MTIFGTHDDNTLAQLRDVATRAERLDLRERGVAPPRCGGELCDVGLMADGQDSCAPRDHGRRIAHAATPRKELGLG